MPRPTTDRHDGSLTPQFPVAEIADVHQLMAVAIGMEHEATLRYRELAAEMRRAGTMDLARLFDDLAKLEAEHEEELVRMAERTYGAAPAPVTFAWQFPETFDEDGVGVLTPYRALSIAVRNEERGFTFYAYLSAASTDPLVRERAEALARGELDHLAELRAMRRRAYHAELRKPQDRRAVHTLDELRALAGRLETRARDFDTAAANALTAIGHPAAAAMRRQAEQDAALAAGAGAAVAPSLDTAALSPASTLGLALKNAEEVFEAYMAAAEQAPDEAVMREAQRLGQHAVARLALIRSQLGEVDD